jgi:hypothetical protein
MEFPKNIERAEKLRYLEEIDRMREDLIEKSALKKSSRWFLDKISSFKKELENAGFQQKFDYVAYHGLCGSSLSDDEHTDKVPYLDFPGELSVKMALEKWGRELAD